MDALFESFGEMEPLVAGLAVVRMAETSLAFVAQDIDEGLLDEFDSIVLHQEGDLGFSLVARIGDESRAIALLHAISVPDDLFDHLMTVSEIDCVAMNPISHAVQPLRRLPLEVTQAPGSSTRRRVRDNRVP